jgi:hypothetical protein
MFRFCAFFSFLFFALDVQAVVWKGKLIDAETKRPIQGAIITNTISQLFVFTNEFGQFDLQGNEGDKVNFSCPGYRSESHIIIKGLEGIRLTFSMKLGSQELKEVVITQKYKTRYQKDSADRRSEQRVVLSRQKSNIASPVSFLAERLSKRQRAIFRFQKQFGTMEEQQFVDSRYTPELVSSLTNLEGDTLAYFMNNYKIPYDYARSATSLELKMWIRYNFKDFMATTDSLKNFKLPY